MSAPDSGQLPSEIEAAIDELYDVGYATRPTKDRARAELTAKIAKYGNTKRRRAALAVPPTGEQTGGA